jgi:proteasome accessory factor B
MAKDFSKKFEGVATRHQLGRMWLIIERIQRGDYPSCRKLADELEVATKTIQRDISYMQNSRCVPIEYDPYKYGYYLTEPVTEFPLLHISEGEVVALFVAQKALAQYRGTPFEQPLRVACEKLIESLDGEFSIKWGDLEAAISFRNIETNPADIAVFKDLSLAVRRCQEVTFDYCKLGAKGFENRRLNPYHLISVNHQWYVLGHDPLRRAVRTFSLARMQKVRILPSTFVRPKSFSAEKLLAGSFGVFAGGKPQEMRIWFDSFAARLVRERIWHHSQQITDLQDGEIELRLTLTSTVEVLPWILGWQNHAKVLEPAELVDQVVKAIRTMGDVYGRAACTETSPNAPLLVQPQHDQTSSLPIR